MPAGLRRSFCLGAAARSVASKCRRAPAWGLPARGLKGRPRIVCFCACPLLPLGAARTPLDAFWRCSSMRSSRCGGRAAAAAAISISASSWSVGISGCSDSPWSSGGGGAGVSSGGSSCGGGSSGGGGWLSVSSGGGSCGGGGTTVARGASTQRAASARSSCAKVSRWFSAACTRATCKASKGARKLSMPSASAAWHSAPRSWSCACTCFRSDWVRDSSSALSSSRVLRLSKRLTASRLSQTPRRSAKAGVRPGSSSPDSSRAMMPKRQS